MLSTNGRHRVLKATTTQRVIAGAGVLGIGLMLPLTSAATASAAAPTHSSEPVRAAGTFSSTSTAAAPAAAAKTAAPAATASRYTVVSGDTLSGIAGAKNVSGGWQALFQLNAAELTQGADLIYPGQELTLSGTATTTKTPSTPSTEASTSPSSTTLSTTTSGSSDSSSSSSSSADAVTQSASTSSSSSATGSASGLAAAVSFAEAQVGDSYVYGATGPSSWDCSGLTQAAFAKAGISIPRVAADQAAATTHVSLSDLQPGDLLFWSSNGSDSGVYHVGIYVGDDKYVEAANPSTGVHVETVSNWAPDFAGRIG